MLYLVLQIRKTKLKTPFLIKKGSFQLKKEKTIDIKHKKTYNTVL